MAFLTAALTLGAAGLSARASRQAGDKASDAARQASGDIRAAADQAREDVLSLFPRTEKQLIGGASQAFDILGQGIGAQQQALSQGNLNAQQTVGGGFNQVQNALLGLPVNTQGFAPQGVDFTQVPDNPFFSEGNQQGLIGAPLGTFQTGQGNVQGSTGQLGVSNIGTSLAGERPPFLNDFATIADQAGRLIRNPDGSTKFDPTGGQVPGSAAITGGDPAFRELQQLRALSPERRTPEQQNRFDQLMSVFSGQSVIG